jgi:uncharacterized protein (DUF952 family)
MIYHIVSPSTWEKAGTVPYRASSLESEGFIHCSYAHQVAWAANRFYRDQDNLLVLCIDPERLTSPVRAEDPGCGESFPHIYGPIERAAIVEVRPLERGADGTWVFQPREN